MPQSDTLFDIAMLEQQQKETPLLLHAGEKHRNFRRERDGKECKCTLRDAHGRIVATVYTGEADAKRIIDCVRRCYEEDTGICQPTVG